MLGLGKKDSKEETPQQFWGNNKQISLVGNKYRLYGINVDSLYTDYLKFKATTPEEHFARELVGMDLPESIEVAVISQFNDGKKIALRYQDRVNAKKKEILQAYK